MRKVLVFAFIALLAYDFTLAEEAAAEATQNATVGTSPFGSFFSASGQGQIDL
jgi:hypothetical protein